MSHRYSDSRERSRQRYHGYRGRSQSSEDSYEKRKKGDRTERRGHNYKVMPLAEQPKRVRFSQQPDIKIFRKEDEPSSKGLTQVELQQFMKKMEAERGSGSFGITNWQKIKHHEAQLEQNSIKQEKEREKALNEKLMGVREDMAYYPPIAIHIRPKETKSSIIQGPEGTKSVQRQALTTRLNDVLGCFYVHQSQTPADPSFQIQNTSTSSQPKNISFDKLIINSSNKDESSKKGSKDQKLLKGILKGLSNGSTDDNQPKKIDPKFVNILRQIYSQGGKSKYSKEQLQSLLAPYKATGQLAYVFSKPQILKNILNTPAPQNPSPAPPPAPVPPSISTPLSTYTHTYPQPQLRTGSISQERDSLPRGNHPHAYGNPPYQKSPSPMGLPRHSPIGPARYSPNPNLNTGPGGYSSYGHPHSGNQPYGRTNTYGQPNYGTQGSGYSNHQYGNNYGHSSSYGSSVTHYQGNMQNKGPNYKYSQPSMGGQLQPQNYPTPGPPNPIGNSMYPQPLAMNRNYKTVPCKYFHSSQGCVKADSCTFIHDIEYAGRPTPAMLKTNRGMIMQSHGMGNEPAGYYYPPPPNQ